MDHAHQAGVIHRDLKPQNIVVDADGQPHVLDFGLAKREAGEISVAVEGKLIGTPAYMSPEQAKGEAHRADRRSDIYSLGAVLFELLTGEKPFRGDAHMVIQQVIHEEATSPRKLNSKIPRDLETICLRCLQKDPLRRYATAKELADELRRFLRGEPIHARPITAASRALRWCRRNPVVATLGATIASLLLFLAIAGPIIAIKQTSLAAKEVAAREELRRRLYVSDMNSALQAWEVGSVGHVIDLLRSHKPAGNQADLRRFEWYYLWRLCQESVNATMLEHVAPVQLVACSVDGDLLASAAADESGTVEIQRWHVEGQEKPKNLKLKLSDVPSTAAFSTDLELLALATSDGKVRVWDLQMGAERTMLGDHTDEVHSLALANNGKWLASQTIHDAVVLWEMSSGKELRTFAAPGKPSPHSRPPGWTASLAFSPDDETLASGGVSGTVTLWKVATGARLWASKGHDRATNCVTFSSDGLQLATASDDTTVKLWSAATGEELLILNGHESAATSVAFSNDGTTVASGGRDNVVVLWDVATGQIRDVVKGHENWVNSVTYLADGHQLASGGYDRTVKLWNVNAPDDVLRGHAGPVWSVSLSPNGGTLASAGTDALVKLWDVETGELLGDLAGHANWVVAVAFAPDGETLVSGESGGAAIKLWDVSRKEERVTLSGHTRGVSAVTFSADGNILASSSGDTTVRLWRAAPNHDGK